MFEGHFDNMIGEFVYVIVVPGYTIKMTFEHLAVYSGYDLGYDTRCIKPQLVFKDMQERNLHATRRNKEHRF